MESANLHHHQHQHHLQGQFDRSSSPSLSSSPSCYGAPSPHAWTQNITLNPDGVGIKQRQKNETSSIPSPLNNSIIPDLGFHWNINTNQHDHILQLGKIKEEEQLSHSFTKFTEMINTPSTLDQDSHQKYMSDLSEKLLLKTISSGFPINSPSQIYSTCIPSSRGNFSQIYPTINISPPPPSFDVNLDLLTSTRFSGSIGQPSRDNNLDIYKDNVPYDLHHMHQSNHLPSSSPRKVSSFTTNEITEAKRPNSSLMEPKATLQAAPKKSRLETRASCAPFKVRKEKLGDRIAALQQLVAPFGKTDTASVLMEAIGYIKFLQNQVETLSVPYMKSSRNKSNRNSQAGSNMEEGNDEPKKDLRSRGLCLVPFSCMSYVTGDGGGTSGGIWPPPNFGGGT